MAAETAKTAALINGQVMQRAAAAVEARNCQDDLPPLKQRPWQRKLPRRRLLKQRPWQLDRCQDAAAPQVMQRKAMAAETSQDGGS